MEYIHGKQGTSLSGTSPMITATSSSMSNRTASSSTSRNTPYPYTRRASAPSIPLMPPLSPLATSSAGPARPSLRSSNTAPGHAFVRSRDSAAVTQPILHGSHSNHAPMSRPNATAITTGGSLPLSLPATLSPSPSPFDATARHSSAFNTNTVTSSVNDPSVHGSSLPALPMSSLLAFSTLATEPATNEYIEHWQVTSKDAARQITDLSLLMSLDQSEIVTFHPHSYVVVNGAQVGQNNWFRAQACTCESYRGGFDRVRRPATIRDHLAKQVCAPASLARVAEIQLKMMRTSSKRLSHTSIPDTSSPKLPPMPEYQRQSTPSGYPASYAMPSVFGSSHPMQLSASERSHPTFSLGERSGPLTLHHPASPSWMPLSAQYASALQSYSNQDYQSLNNYPKLQFSAHQLHAHHPNSGYNGLEMSRSWPTSNYHHSISSPFFGWSTDSEHAPSSASMSTNNSDLGSASGLGLGFGMNTSHGLSSRQHVQQPTGNYRGDHYSFGSTVYGAGGSGGLAQSGGSSALGDNQPMFPSPPKDVHNSDSPLFGTESESLFTFDDM